MQILHGRIKPIAIFHAEDDGGGGTATEEPPQKLGTAFSRMQEAMKADADPAKEDAKETPKDTPKDDAAKETPKADGKPKKTPRDPLLDVLSGDAAKAAPAKEEPAPNPELAAEIDAATKGMSGKAADNFRKITSEREEWRVKASDLQKQLDAAKAAPMPPEVKLQLEQFEALKQEHAEVVAVMEKIGAERSPTYTKKFVEGRKGLIDKAESIIRKNGADPKAFAEAIGMQGTDRKDALDALFGTLSSVDSARVGNLLTEIEVLDEESESFISNARESLMREEKEAQTQELARRQEAAKAQEQNFMSVVNKMLHKFPEGHPLAEEANPMVDATIQKAQEFLFKNDNFEEFAKAAVAHSMFPIMQEKLVASAQRIAELETMLEEFESADPTMRDGGGGKLDGQQAEAKSLADRYKGAMAGV